jgi:carboxyl-terminal processing protease
MPTEFQIKVRKSAGVYLALVLIAASFLWGYHYGSAGSPPPGGSDASASNTVEIINAGENQAETKLDFKQFWSLWQTIRERYARQPVDEKKMFYGAMAGMVDALGDQHSVYFDPEKNKEFQQELSGKFEGIGAEIGIKKERLVIIAPLPGSPAEKAGLKAGDHIVGIDDAETFEMTVDEAVRLIRGDKGTKVKLHIMRDGFKEPKPFEIVRDTIQVQSVKVEMVKSPAGKKLARITISHYNGDTAEKFIEAVAQLDAAALDGIVLDLRNNPGGYLDAAVQILGEWVPGEIVVSERYSDGSLEDSRTSGFGRLRDLKTIVLVNGGSASASEITAGALQDHGKAKLLGTQTFGKGSVQDLIPFRDGSSVKLTIAEWLTPNGTNINENGIKPDYEVIRADDEYENDKDSQLDAARAWFDGVEPPAPKADAKKAETKE